MTKCLDSKVYSDPGSISLQNVWLPTYPLGAVVKGNAIGPFGNRFISAHLQYTVGASIFGHFSKWVPCWKTGSAPKTGCGIMVLLLSNHLDFPSQPSQTFLPVVFSAVHLFCLQRCYVFLTISVTLCRSGCLGCYLGLAGHYSCHTMTCARPVPPPGLFCLRTLSSVLLSPSQVLELYFVLSALAYRGEPPLNILVASVPLSSACFFDLL